MGGDGVAILQCTEFLFLFFVFSILQLVDNILPMTGLELQISPFRSDRSSNWATTTALRVATSLNSYIGQPELEEESSLIEFEEDFILWE